MLGSRIGSTVRAGALALACAGAAACAAAPPPEPPAPTINAEQVALRLELTTQLEGPARILFSWSASERDARFSGRGVARIEPPYKARLDLFFGNGETIARAALINDDLRLPPGMPAGLLPPPELLWSTLGVFRPGPDIALMGAEDLGDGQIRIRYRRPDGLDLRYTVKDGLIVEVDRLRNGQTVELVTIARAGNSRYPSQATYRNIAAYRELKLTRDSVESVESYPPDLWDITP